MSICSNHWPFYYNDRRPSHVDQRHFSDAFSLASLRTDRKTVDLKTYRPSKLWETRRAGRGLQINPAHKDYPALLAEAMDVLAAKGWDVARTAGVMGLSMSQLSKLLRHDKQAFGHVNDIREERGLPRLK